MATIKLMGLLGGIQKGSGDTDTLETDGSLTVGNSDTDTIVVNAEFDSDLVPDDDNTYDLGATTKRWRRGYFDEIITKLHHVNTAKYTEGSAVQRYVRWDAAGSNGAPGVNNKFVAPANGQLLEVRIRATNISNMTSVALHKASNGTENLSTSPTETVDVNMSAANTTYAAMFDSNSFSAGDILGISLSPDIASVPPTAGFGNVNITCVWLLDWALE